MISAHCKDKNGISSFIAEDGRSKQHCARGRGMMMCVRQSPSYFRRTTMQPVETIFVDGHFVKAVPV